MLNILVTFCSTIIRLCTHTANLKQIDRLKQVGITTNGIMLTRLLVPMHRAGLDAINISLDTLKASKYEMITRRRGMERALAGIDLAVQLGFKPKVNCVVMRGFNDQEVVDFVGLTRERPIDVRFIEYMPFGGNKWEMDKMVSYRDMLATITERYPDFVALPNGPNDTSKAYAVPGFAGQVGFITSMTDHFCGSCNRLRLTADGNLKVCLFGNTEVSLRDAMREQKSEADLTELISAAVKRKKKQHAGEWRMNLCVCCVCICSVNCCNPLIVVALEMHALQSSTLFIVFEIRSLCYTIHTRTISWSSVCTGMQNLSHMENRPMILIGG